MKNITLIILTLFLTSLQAFAEEKLENVAENSTTAVTQEDTDALKSDEKSSKQPEITLLERLKNIEQARIKIYEFNPVKNTKGFITIIEFNDLSCKECLKKSAEFYSLIGKDNLKNVKLIYKHINSNKTELINQTTVYGLVAAKLNKFWEFKNEIITNEYKTNEEMITAMMSVGVSKEELYDNLMLNSDQFYKNIDADDKYAQTLNSKQTPMFYIDGYKIGADIMPDEVSTYIAEKTTEYMQAKEKEDNKYNMGKF